MFHCNVVEVVVYLRRVAFLIWEHLFDVFQVNQLVYLLSSQDVLAEGVWRVSLVGSLRCRVLRGLGYHDSLDQLIGSFMDLSYRCVCDPI